MAPIRQLPVLQNWDCHQCGSCCTDYWVPVSEEERQRILAQGWEQEPEYRGVKLFVKYGPPWRRRYRLALTTGDRCVFLDERGLCKIHAKFGLHAKPFACRLYPYILVPHGDHWRVSMRFACPSAAANKGRSLTQAVEELGELAREMEKWDQRPGFQRTAGPGLGDPPSLDGRQRVNWSDFHLFQDAVVRLFSVRNDDLARRWLKCLALARLCREARFDNLTGGRLHEFLDLMLAAVAAETPRTLDGFEPPGWIGRLLFRQALAIYVRKDQGVRRGVSKRGRLALLAASWRMIRGTGKLPMLQVGLPDCTFEELEKPLGALPKEAAQSLERYYYVKLTSLQFCGPTFYHYPFWDGLEALALTYPMIRWLIRGFAYLGQPEATHRAISVIDENFGYSPLLGTARQRLALWILSFRKELDKLIAWYGR
jgi:lysine-N-methylase